MIERRLENLLALDYPADKVEIVVASDASDDRTDEIVAQVRQASPAREPACLPARRQGGGAEPRRRREQGRGRRLLRRQCDLGALRPAPADRQPRRPRGRLRLRTAAARAGGRVEQGGRLLALRALAARLGVAAGLDHGRQRLDLCAQARRLCRCRSPLRPRSLAALPDGAEAAPRRLRAPGAGAREADSIARERVPAQGAHVRALLADHAAGLDAEAR